MSNAKSLRTRIKSINSTMHITKAMEIVASSKFKKASIAMDKSNQYLEALNKVFASLSKTRDKSVFFTDRPVVKSCIIVIAGDRGLAGGYNSNIFKMAASYAKENNVCVVPIGKKAVEYFKKTKLDIYEEFMSSEKVDINRLVDLSDRLTKDFVAGNVDEIRIFHTKYLSILSQESISTKILPIAPNKEDTDVVDFSYEPSIGAVLASAVPQYICSTVNGYIAESFLCELSSRRNAMNSANKNAEEMIDDLNLQYNRARQAAITQEITEIVAGT